MDPSSRHIDDQSAASQYPPPVSHNEQSDHDFAETAAAALLSAQPSEHAISHRPTPISHAITDTPNPRKRKPAAPGSRGVANLTPEQLAKKRANDREAQRAIRVRTKTTIETLERRIQELETQLPYQEVQKAYAERDRALAECEDLRRRLAAVAGIVGSQNLGQTGLNREHNLSLNSLIMS